MNLTETDIEICTRQLQINGINNPTNNQIAMEFVRTHRNGLLTESDWMGNSDVQMSNEWSTYRQALRDLPSTASPSLDEDGNLTGVNWPEKPE